MPDTYTRRGRLADVCGQRKQEVRRRAGRDTISPAFAYIVYRTAQLAISYRHIFDDRIRYRQLGDKHQQENDTTEHSAWPPISITYYIHSQCLSVFSDLSAEFNHPSSRRQRHSMNAETMRILMLMRDVHTTIDESHREFRKRMRIFQQYRR